MGDIVLNDICECGHEMIEHIFLFQLEIPHYGLCTLCKCKLFIQCKKKLKDSELTCPICHKGFSKCNHSLTAMIKEYNKIIKQALDEIDKHSIIVTFKEEDDCDSYIKSSDITKILVGK